MSIRFYQLAVFCFWLATATWLISTKLMPALRRGDPPNHHAASVAKLANTPPVIWDIKWNFQSVGWAANKIITNHAGQIELLSRLQFTSWPKSNSNAASWLSKQLTEIGKQGGGFQMQLTNRSVLDDDYRLKTLQSIITLGSDPEMSSPWIRIDGDVHDNQLQLAFHLGNRHLGNRTIPIRSDCLIDSEISPYGFMPRLRMHQEWTAYQISPLRSPMGPQTPIVAKVERFEPLVWENQTTDTFLITYRRDEGSGSRSVEDYLGRLWVRPDNGMVLQQEIVLLGSHIRLVRQTPKAAEPLIRRLEQNWNAACNNIDLKKTAHPIDERSGKP